MKEPINFKSQENILVIILIAFLCFFLLFQMFPFKKGPMALSISTAQQDLIQVSAQGKAKVTPDTVLISAGVRVSKQENAEKAMSTMNESINALQEILKNNGIEPKNIQTTDLSVYEEFDYNSTPSSKRESIGYQASSTLKVRVEKKETAVVNTILDQMAKVANVRINNIGYDISDSSDVYSSARKDALEKAYAKAQEIAKITGVQITGVKEVIEGAPRNNFPPYRGVFAEMAADNGPSNTNISPGEEEYMIEVSVSYGIK